MVSDTAASEYGIPNFPDNIHRAAISGLSPLCGSQEVIFDDIEVVRLGLFFKSSLFFVTSKKIFHR